VTGWLDGYLNSIQWLDLQDYWTFTDGKVCNTSSAASTNQGGFGLTHPSNAKLLPPGAGTVDLWNDYTGLPEKFGTYVPSFIVFQETAMFHNIK
jgi:hypothetical protein